ncbi:hypothetical protein [Acidianus hospitalis]|uniref:hypothetical protein n=1 Tax=Acidianus hospitalis TaxID=563177 RepID=UPI00064ED168|nr:hypothetical protein [Acidianus hospitalis]
MSEEAIARALASNEDFARKVADLIADKIVIKKIDELTKEVEKLSKTMQDLVDQQKLVWEKFEENDKKFNQIMEKIDKAIEEMKEENKKRDEKFEVAMESIERENKKRDKTINKLLKHNQQILRTLGKFNWFFRTGSY